jgi:hypothetical protein
MEHPTTNPKAGNVEKPINNNRKEGSGSNNQSTSREGK